MFSIFPFSLMSLLTDCHHTCEHFGESLLYYTIQNDDSYITVKVRVSSYYNPVNGTFSAIVFFGKAVLSFHKKLFTEYPHTHSHAFYPAAQNQMLAECQHFTCTHFHWS